MRKAIFKLIKTELLISYLVLNWFMLEAVIARQL